MRFRRLKKFENLVKPNTLEVYIFVRKGEKYFCNDVEFTADQVQELEEKGYQIINLVKYKKIGGNKNEIK